MSPFPEKLNDRRTTLKNGTTQLMRSWSRSLVTQRVSIVGWVSWVQWTVVDPLVALDLDLDTLLCDSPNPCQQDHRTLLLSQVQCTALAGVYKDTTLDNLRCSIECLHNWPGVNKLLVSLMELVAHKAMHLSSRIQTEGCFFPCEIDGF